MFRAAHRTIASFFRWSRLPFFFLSFNTPQELRKHSQLHPLHFVIPSHDSFTLQLIAKDRNSLQHTETHCNALQKLAGIACSSYRAADRTIATHCNTPQHTATHCNTLQLTATHLNTLQELAGIARSCILFLPNCLLHGS